MSIAADLRTIARLAFCPIRGGTHGERLESFYRRQAADYDVTRPKMLWGRDELFSSIPSPKGGVWVDFGGGTGANLLALGDGVRRLREAIIVDLSESLLEVAERRIQERSWKNVRTVRADATTFSLPAGSVDVATFSYSLTMIPDWFAAVDRAWEMLAEGGTIGVVDFYVSRKYPADSRRRHGWPARQFWPAWFGNDNVFPSPDHLPYLERRFATERLVETTSRIRYLPFFRPPCYLFVGKKNSHRS